MGSRSSSSIWGVRTLEQSFHTLHDLQPFQGMHRPIYSYFLNKATVCNFRKVNAFLPFHPCQATAHRTKPIHPLNRAQSRVLASGTQFCMHGTATSTGATEHAPCTLKHGTLNSKGSCSSGGEPVVRTVQAQGHHCPGHGYHWLYKRKTNTEIKVIHFFEVYIEIEIKATNCWTSPDIAELIRLVLIYKWLQSLQTHPDLMPQISLFLALPRHIKICPVLNFIIKRQGGALRVPDQSQS